MEWQLHSAIECRLITTHGQIFFIKQCIYKCVFNWMIHCGNSLCVYLLGWAHTGHGWTEPWQSLIAPTPPWCVLMLCLKQSTPGYAYIIASAHQTTVMPAYMFSDLRKTMCSGRVCAHIETNCTRPQAHCAQDHLFQAVPWYLTSNWINSHWQS